MAVDKRDRIYPEDAFNVVYETRVIEDTESSSYGVPAQPIEGYARILDKTTGQWLVLGTDEYGTVEIDPMTSSRGALIKFRVTPIITANPGDYTIFMTAVFADGTVQTEDRDFKVLEFS